MHRSPAPNLLRRRLCPQRRRCALSHKRFRQHLLERGPPCLRNLAVSPPAKQWRRCKGRQPRLRPRRHSSCLRLRFGPATRPVSLPRKRPCGLRRTLQRCPYLWHCRHFRCPPVWSRDEACRSRLPSLTRPCPIRKPCTCSRPCLPVPRRCLSPRQPLPVLGSTPRPPTMPHRAFPPVSATPPPPPHSHFPGTPVWFLIQPCWHSPPARSSCPQHQNFLLT